jgi:hypothetical protein
MTPRCLVLAALVAALAAVPAPPAAAGVIVVDPAGGGDFTLLKPAIAAAIDGDTILIRPTFVGNFTDDLSVKGKSLTIVGDVPPGSGANGAG